MVNYWGFIYLVKIFVDTGYQFIFCSNLYFPQYLPFHFTEETFYKIGHNTCFGMNTNSNNILVHCIESISLLKSLENRGLQNRPQNKSPDKIMEIRHLRNCAGREPQNCD